MTTALANRALLVRLNISQWTARKLDRKETSEVTTRAKCHSRAARVNKSLLPGSDALEKIAAKSGEIRKFHYANTLPWGGDNTTIIRCEGYLEFTQQMRVLMDDWWKLVDQFVAEYPTLCIEAQLKLGSLYEANDYPHPSDIRERFNIDVSFMPVPDVADWRVTLADDTVAELQAGMLKEVKRAQSTAMNEAWRRLFEVVEHAHERLSKPDSVFRASLIENARQVCAVLPSLNIMDDPELERMRQQVEGALCSYDAKDLRKQPDLRENAARKLSEIMSSMGPMYQAAA